MQRSIKMKVKIKNFEIAKILYEIAIYLDMQGEKFKPRAYEKAARSIEALTEEVADIFARGGIEALKEIPGVGESIAQKIAELVQTGKLEYYEKLKKEIPVDVAGLSAIEGVGPKKIKTLYQKLKIKTVEDLEKAAREGKIRKLPHFGEKSEQDILKSIEFLKKGKGRALLGYILPLAKEIEDRLKKLPEVKQVALAGSARRMKETVGDLDFLVVSDKPEKVMDFFVSMPEVVDILGKGKTKSMVRLKVGIDADLRVVEEKSFGAALQYFTGNKEHNIALRKIAIEKGWKLSEYGVFDKHDKYIAGRTEEEVYAKLGLQWMPPEMRENAGEVELALQKKIPKLIEYDSLQGDLQVQTNWTDGASTIAEYVAEARKLGLKYIVITDHTKSLAFTGGLDERMLLKQKEEIEKINKQSADVTVLSGAEVNILKDGSLDINDATLKQLDVVGAAVHSHFNMSKEEMTKRIIRAMKNPNVDILFHPTGRVIQKREPYEVDIEQITDAAKETGTILEIDSFPDRLDLKDEHVRLAKKSGCKFSIDSDAHSTVQMHYLQFGIGVARRGWLEAKDVVNTMPLDKFLKQLK
jgi:DNA polymerase (family 10)